MLFGVLSSGSIGTRSAFRNREQGLYYRAYLGNGSGESILCHNPRVSELHSCTQTCLKGQIAITRGNDRIMAILFITIPTENNEPLLALGARQV